MGLHDTASAALRVAADGQVSTGHSLLTAVRLLGGTTNSSIKLYDGTDATGTLKWEISMDAVTEAGDNSLGDTFSNPIDFPNGIFADITGTGAIAYVGYHAF